MQCSKNEKSLQSTAKGHHSTEKVKKQQESQCDMTQKSTKGTEFAHQTTDPKQSLLARKEDLEWQLLML